MLTNTLIFLLANEDLITEYRYFALASLLSGIVVGFTASSIYESFGPASAELRDPFEEHED